MLFKIMCSEKSLEIHGHHKQCECLKDLFQLDIKMNKDFLFMPFSLGFWKKYHVKAYMDTMENGTDGFYDLPLPCQALIFHLSLLFRIQCVSFHSYLVQSRYCFFVLILLEKVLLFFFIILLTFCCSCQGTNPGLPIAVRHHSPLGTYPRFIYRNHCITIFCIQVIDTR